MHYDIHVIAIIKEVEHVGYILYVIHVLDRVYYMLFGIFTGNMNLYPL